MHANTVFDALNEVHQLVRRPQVRNFPHQQTQSFLCCWKREYLSDRALEAYLACITCFVIKPNRAEYLCWVIMYCRHIRAGKGKSDPLKGIYPEAISRRSVRLYNLKATKLTKICNFVSETLVDSKVRSRNPYTIWACCRRLHARNRVRAEMRAQE